MGKNQEQNEEKLIAFQHWSAIITMPLYLIYSMGEKSSQCELCQYEKWEHALTNIVHTFSKLDFPEEKTENTGEKWNLTDIHKPNK